MAAVKPMMQQPSGAKPNSSYNNNNEPSAAPSMQQEMNVTQVERMAMFLSHPDVIQLILYLPADSDGNTRKSDFA